MLFFSAKKSKKTNIFLVEKLPDQLKRIEIDYLEKKESILDNLSRIITINCAKKCLWH